jgi:hypothetical protein
MIRVAAASYPWGKNIRYSYLLWLFDVVLLFGFGVFSLTCSLCFTEVFTFPLSLKLIRSSLSIHHFGKSTFQHNFQHNFC